MPQLSRLAVRAALVYLLSGVTVGALLLTHKGLPLHSALWGWLPLHIEFLLIGWLLQLTMGVAFWIMPRFWAEPRRPKEGYAWVAVALLNVGLWLVAAGTTFRAGWVVVVVGRAAELAAVLFFTRHAWTRIVSREG